MISFNVTIIDDNIAECAELFTFDLEILAAYAALGVMKGSPDIATVNIMDDDGEHIHCMMPSSVYNVILKYHQQVQSMHLFVHAVEELMISLDSDAYSVREDVGTFMAAITATRVADFPYTVSVDSTDGTAVGNGLI